MQKEPPREQPQPKKKARRTSSNPKPKKQRGPHASKGAAEEPQKQAKTPQMQAHGETPHEMGKEDTD